MISFNKAVTSEKMKEYISDVIDSGRTGGIGKYTRKCEKLLESRFDAKRVLLTTSGTSALEMAAILCDLIEGDEVIMPSFTFVSTANAFVMRRAKVVFVDIDRETMNIDPLMVENAINERTRVIAIVHYAGVSCDMDRIMAIAKAHGLKVVEDAAQAVMGRYRDRYLGTIGDYGCYSFHETKNYSMGEGGALVINNKEDIERAEIIRENGTDRSKYLEGLTDKYTWLEPGASYRPSDLLAAYLYAQLEMLDQVNSNRIDSWNHYYKLLKPLSDKDIIELPVIPGYAIHNGHMFYIKCGNKGERSELIAYLRSHDIGSAFHYIPLHSSPAGLKYGRFSGMDLYTTCESERLLRLPMYYNISPQDIEEVCTTIKSFYKSK